MTAQSPPLEQRECGECQACCVAIPIVTVKPVIDKPAHTPCSYLCATGCTIYEERPQPCKVYTCWWLRGWGTLRDRPDKSGLILEAMDSDPPAVIVTEAFEGGTASRRSKIRIKGLQKQLPVIVLRVNDKDSSFHGSDEELAAIRSLRPAKEAEMAALRERLATAETAAEETPPTDS